MDKPGMLKQRGEHNHIALFYDDPQERIDFLAGYFADGLSRHELCVFVTPVSPDRAVQDFTAAGLDITPALKRGDFRMFNAIETYLPEGHFKIEFMLGNVSNFIDDAIAQGYAGLRTAGEMDWLIDASGATDDAVMYESLVNNLIDSSDFVGLCVYPVLPSSLRLLTGAVRTHPTFVYNGGQHANPYYFPPSAEVHPAISSLEATAAHWLDNVKRHEENHPARGRAHHRRSEQAVKKLLLRK